MNPSVEGLLVETGRILEAVEDRKATIRLIGSLAVRLHSADHVYLVELLGRSPYRDLDFVAYARDAAAIRAAFESVGYEADANILRSQEFGIKRLIFHGPGGFPKVDVFIDALVMAHQIPFAGRLNLDHPTVSLVDLLLSKLQIEKITENDVKDLIVLLAEHELGSGNTETIDAAYLLTRMSRDWGFYHTATKNLVLAEHLLAGYTQLPREVSEFAVARIRDLIGRMETAPKSTAWKLRARVGTRVRWYEDVEDVDR